MTSKHFIAGIVLTAFAVTAGAASAGNKGGHKSHRMSFEQLDADGNGEVTKAEMQAAAKARFADADANGDGALSRDEMLAAANARAEKRVDRMMERMDANGDGKITPDERPGMPDEKFDKIDADGSGGISKEEFAEMRKHGRKHRDKNRDKKKN